MKQTTFCGMVLIVIAVLAAGGAAQAATEGRIVGVVTDEAGTPLPGVKIVLTATETNAKQKGKTNKKGEFKMIVLNATRSYSITLELEGYATIQEPIELQIGGIIREAWTMSQGQAAATPAPQQQGALTASIEGSNKAGRLYKEGLEAYTAGDMDAAIEKFQGIVELDPELPDPYLALALSYYQKEMMEQSISNAQKLLEIRPDDGAGMRILFEAQSRLGDKEGAAETLADLVVHAPGPDTARALFNAGVAHVRAGELEQAISVFEVVREMDPELGETYAALARISFDLGKLDQSLAYAKEAQAKMPQDAEVLGLQYLIYTLQGMPDEAGQVFVTLQSVSPQYVGAGFYQQGVNMFNMGDGEQSAVIFERVLQTLPDHPGAHYMMGLTEMSRGNFAEAKRLLERFVELAPNDPEAATAREMLSSL